MNPNDRALGALPPLAEGRASGPSARLDSLYARAANLSFRDLLFHCPEHEPENEF